MGGIAEMMGQRFFLVKEVLLTLEFQRVLDMGYRVERVYAQGSG